MRIGTSVQQNWLSRPKSRVLFLIVGFALLSASCASDRAELQVLELDAARRQVDSAIREAKAEAATLRNEMAATRIAAAKKEAELQELRRQVADLRQAQTEQHRTVDAKQTELTTLRTERDQLLQAKAEIQAQLAELPQLRQAAAGARAAETSVQARLKQLESALAVLTAELEQVKQDLTRIRNESDAKSRKSARAGKTPRSP